MDKQKYILINLKKFQMNILINYSIFFQNSRSGHGEMIRTSYFKEGAVYLVTITLGFYLIHGEILPIHPV